MGRAETRIAILGAGGQLGRALTEALGDSGVPLTREHLDLTNLEQAEATLNRIAPTALINAAAYNAVDRAESETALAFRVNGEAPGMLARWSSGRGLPFVHFSTDYVFPGTGSRPWTEEDPVAPLNAYGRSKQDGERAVAAEGGRWLVFRTSWLYDESGRNFLTTMLRLGRERETLQVVDDQWGAPTYAKNLAQAAIEALAVARAQPAFPSGIYHACNAGEATWRRFARAIFDAERAAGRPLAVRSVIPIATVDYPSPAARPLNSRLNVEKLRTALGVTLPSWEEGLAACMQRLG